MTEWEGYYPDDARVPFQPGMLVLDVGCGSGYQMKQMLELGCSVIGLDIDPAALQECRQKRLSVVTAQAEHIPFADASCEGILCQVVLPYTREEAAFPLTYTKENKFWPSVARVNNTHGDRNLICTCPDVSSYEMAEEMSIK